jgi:hypothetical protein
MLGGKHALVGGGGGGGVSNLVPKLALKKWAVHRTKKRKMGQKWDPEFEIRTCACVVQKQKKKSLHLECKETLLQPLTSTIWWSI